MTTAVPLTLYLLVLIGAYEFTAGLAGFTGRMDWNAMIEEFERSPALTFVTGFIAFAIGGAIVIGHHHWTDVLAIIVSAIGVIAIVEGLLIMVSPKPLLLLVRPVVRGQRGISIVAMIFGAALIALGVTGNVAAGAIA